MSRSSLHFFFRGGGGRHDGPKVEELKACARVCVYARARTRLSSVKRHMVDKEGSLSYYFFISSSTYLPSLRLTKNMS